MRINVNNEDRKRIVDAYISGKSIKDITEILKFKRQTVNSIIKIYNTEGRINKLKRGGRHNEKLNNEQKNEIKEWINENASITLLEISNKINAKYHILISKSTISRIIENFHYSFKRISLIPVRRNNQETKLIRKNYVFNRFNRREY